MSKSESAFIKLLSYKNIRTVVDVLANTTGNTTN